MARLARGLSWLMKLLDQVRQVLRVRHYSYRYRKGATVRNQCWVIAWRLVGRTR